MPLFVRVKGFKLGKRILGLPCSVRALWPLGEFSFVYFFSYSIKASGHICSINLRLKSIQKTRFITVEVHSPVRFVFLTNKFLICS